MPNMPKWDASNYLTTALLVIAFVTCVVSWL